MISKPEVGTFFFWFFFIVTVVWTIVAIFQKLWEILRRRKN
ncbi:hypothetical protein [Phorcysia thermohydrogeniphila]|nr:hypothetical protein [Phorcysia thermohydrogeniphila]